MLSLPAARRGHRTRARRAGIALVVAGVALPVTVAGGPAAAVDPVGTLSLLAGSGTPGAPVAGPALVSPLYNPTNVAVDAAGNTYIADSTNNRVEKVSASGVLSVIAGTGSYGAPTAGVATSSRLRGPRSVAVDAAGNVYIADFSSSLVEKVTPGGTLSIYAGNGTTAAPTPGPATSSSLNYPADIALDSAGNLFIADYFNQVVEKVTPAGVLSIVAGTGSLGAPTPGPATSSSLRNPFGVAVDGAGNLYIADTFNYRVEKVSPAGELSVVAGTGTSGIPEVGPATSSPLNLPVDVAVDSTGGMYISDYNANRVLRVNTSGQLAMFAGTGVQGSPVEGPALSSGLRTPYGLALDSTDGLYIADTGNHRVEKIASSIPVPQAPSAPTGLSVTPLSAGVQVVFTPGSAGTSPVTSWEISTDGGSSWSSLATSPGALPGTLTGTVNGLTSGVAYPVTVRAVSAVGPGAAATPSTVTPIASVPSAPGPLALTAVDGGAVVVFTPGADNGSAITGYVVSLDAGAWLPFPTAAGSASGTRSGTVTGLANGALHVVAVSAVNAVGSSPYSAGSILLPAVTAPGTVTGLTTVSGDQTATVVFAPGPAGTSPVTSWQVSTDGGSSWSSLATSPGALPGTLTGTVTGLTNGVAYPVTVRAVSAVGPGAVATSSTVTPAAVLPAAATGLGATAGDTEATVVFTPAVPGSSPVTGWEVSTDGGSTWSSLPTTAGTAPGTLTGTVTGLTNGVTYSVTVRAMNAVGPGPASVGSTVTPTAAPCLSYVCQVYRDLLGRSPEPAGQAAWSSMLAGGLSRASFTGQITSSAEYRTRLVDDAYDRFLGRTAEPAGLAGWTSALAGGLTVQQMQTAIASSAESYALAGGADSAWVTAMYSGVLDRTAGAAEVTAWVTALPAQGRFAVAAAIVGSPEHLTAVVEGYYAQLLGRPGDTVSRDLWVAALQGGMRQEKVVAGFAASEEYFAGTTG